MRKPQLVSIIIILSIGALFRLRVKKKFIRVNKLDINSGENMVA